MTICCPLCYSLQPRIDYTRSPENMMHMGFEIDVAYEVTPRKTSDDMLFHVLQLEPRTGWTRSPEDLMHTKFKHKEN